MILCLFTNCHNGCLSNPTIFKSLNSWQKTFKNAREIEIYCDPNPNPQYYDAYEQMIKGRIGVLPHKTNGLADGWKRAIDTYMGEYIFICEADWTFQNVNHSIDEIVGIMRRDGLWDMKFNKYENAGISNGTKYQSYFKAVEGKEYCLTDGFSNYPQVLYTTSFREKYMNMVDWTLPRVGKIEDVLQRNVEVAVYGKYAHPPTSVHLNMRRGGKK